MNNKRCNTNIDYEISENGSLEDNNLGKLSENAEGEIPEVRALTQAAVNEQKKVLLPPSQRSWRK